MLLSITVDVEKIKKGYKKQLEKEIRDNVAVLIDPIIKKINKQPENIELYNELGIIYARINYFAEAEEAFFRLLSDPKLKVSGFINLGNCSLINGDIEKAKEYYQKVLETKNAPPEILINLAILNYDSGDLESARKLYNDFQKKKPDAAKQFAYIENDIDDSAKASAFGSVRSSENFIWSK
jgi:Flp pilus assembly protein TadD